MKIKNMIQALFIMSLVLLLADLRIKSANIVTNSTNRQDYVLGYNQPATDWMTEALPKGNGKMGGMVFGGIIKEHIQFKFLSLL